MKPALLLTSLLFATSSLAQQIESTSFDTYASESQTLIILLPEGTERGTDDESVADGTRFGVGFGGSIIAWGLSGTMDMTSKITLQGTLGALGTFTAFGGSVWYRFNQNDAYDLFAFGGASHIGFSLGGSTQSTQGFGGGAGIEWDWGDLFNSEDFPPIFSNGTIGFYTYGQDFAGLSAFWVGGGAHYRF